MAKECAVESSLSRGERRNVSVPEQRRGIEPHEAGRRRSGSIRALSDRAGWRRQAEFPRDLIQGPTKLIVQTFRDPTCRMRGGCGVRRLTGMAGALAPEQAALNEIGRFLQAARPRQLGGFDEIGQTCLCPVRVISHRMIAFLGVGHVCRRAASGSDRCRIKADPASTMGSIRLRADSLCKDVSWFCCNAICVLLHCT